ncbi:MAG: leucyl aminopeptidase [Deltaproteobacteria bacterium]|nr:leucyl aminopeptidase [Deltaproteobacteria bacterium]
MNIVIKKTPLSQIDCPVVLAFLFEDAAGPEGAAAVIDSECRGMVKRVLDRGDFKGTLNETLLLFTETMIPAPRVLLVGMGKKEDFTRDRLRAVFAGAARAVRGFRIREFAASLDLGTSALSPAELAESAIEGTLLGLYRYTAHKTQNDKERTDIERLVIVDDKSRSLKDIRDSIGRAEIISRAVLLVRDLVSAPGNELTPQALAAAAEGVARHRAIKLTVLDEKRMKRLGMHALLGVAGGSTNAPRLIVMEYRGGKQKDRPIVLVGKGITFDSGGIDIKPPADMDEMKDDMAGGAAVIGIIQAAADLKLPANIVGIVPAAENLPDGRAYRPGDILRSLSGKTIEIKNTDAEGRLILADALTYSLRYDPVAVIDMATLTGACVVALGRDVTGMLGNDESLKQLIRGAADRTGEAVWELPLREEYRELIKSDVADLKNSGGREAGAISAALFLSSFVEDRPWVHLDIAGPAFLKKDRTYTPKGASGVGVRLITQFLIDHTRKSNESRS